MWGYILNSPSIEYNYPLVYVSDFKYSIVLSPYVSEFSFGKCCQLFTVSVKVKISSG